MDILEENDNFSLSDEVNGPVLAVAVSIQSFMGIITNLFVLIFTLCHPKTMKEPSIIFLTNFVLVNLPVVFIVMPSLVVTAAAGEWVFGKIPEEKNGTCQFVGFVFVYTGFLMLLTLGVISVDRFLFLVKPVIHKRFMKTWVALVIVIIVWVLSCLLSIPPYFGLSQFVFVSSIGTCGIIWTGQQNYLLFFCLATTVVIVIILITTVWTFCFTRKFIQRIVHQHHLNSVKDTNNSKHVYTQRMKKLIGVFGMLLLGMMLTYLPGILVAMVAAVIGNKVPTVVFTSAMVLFFFNFILNPVIQSYFRRDVYEYVMHLFKDFKSICGQKLDVSKATMSRNHNGNSGHAPEFCTYDIHGEPDIYSEHV